MIEYCQRSPKILYHFFLHYEGLSSDLSLTIRGEGGDSMIAEWMVFSAQWSSKARRIRPNGAALLWQEIVFLFSFLPQMKARRSTFTVFLAPSLLLYFFFAHQCASDTWAGVKQRVLAAWFTVRRKPFTVEVGPTSSLDDVGSSVARPQKCASLHLRKKFMSRGGSCLREQPTIVPLSTRYKHQWGEIC